MPCGRRRALLVQRIPWLRFCAACVACTLRAVAAVQLEAERPTCTDPLYSLSCAKEFGDFATEIFQLKIMLLNASYDAATRSAAVGGWHFVLLRPLIEMADLTVVPGEDMRSDGAGVLDIFGGDGTRRSRHRRRGKRRNRNRRLPNTAKEAATGDRALVEVTAMEPPPPARLVPQSIDARARCQADPACCQVTNVYELAVYQRLCLGKAERPVLIHVPRGQACGLAPIVADSASAGATVAFITAGMNLDGWPFVTLRGGPAVLNPGDYWYTLKRNGACAKDIVRQIGVRFWFVTQHRPDFEADYFPGSEKVRCLPLGIGDANAAGGLLEVNMLGRIRAKRDALIAALQCSTASGDGCGSNGCVAEAVEGASPFYPSFNAPTLDLLSASFERITEQVTHRENTSAILAQNFAPYLQVGTSAVVETDKVLSSVFVASPRGMGADTWLHWQALAYGAIPLVDHDKKLFRGDRLLTQLPALPVDSWQLVTCANLRIAAEKVLEELRADAFNYTKLTIEFWTGKVNTTLLEPFDDRLPPPRRESELCEHITSPGSAC